MGFDSQNCNSFWLACASHGRLEVCFANASELFRRAAMKAPPLIAVLRVAFRPALKGKLQRFSLSREGCPQAEKDIVFVPLLARLCT